jgi:uncharacterized protein (TIGR00290 family)
MSAPLKTFFNWSTGKDSALALYKLQRDPRYSIEHLLTSVNAAHDRVSMHGLRRSLLERQIAALGLPASTIELPEEPGMQIYEDKMRQAVGDLQRAGFTCSAFGDIFLEDLRRYREEKLASIGLTAAFPLWKQDTRTLISEFIALGFKAVTVCVDLSVLDASFAGREVDASFVADLPAGVDPCGENGEFHTFCYAGPIFKEEIRFDLGEKVTRQYKSSHSFCFCDLTP